MLPHVLVRLCLKMIPPTESRRVLRYGINYPRNCMAQSSIARTLISFCTNLSSIVLVAMLLMHLVCCVRCTFVFVFPSCHRFFLGCWRQTEQFASQRGEEHLRRTLLLMWCKDRDRNGSEDAARDCRHVC
jgi:hypothetical protein